MPKQVAFLRAINVGGRIVKMDALRAHCEACGLANVETFIASGNVIFDSRAGAAALEKTIETALRGKLGYEVATFVRSVPELQALVKAADAARAGAMHAYVGFMKATAAAEARKQVAAMAGTGERFVFKGREVFWFTDGGVSDSKFTYAVLERLTKSPATFRNITTVTKIAARYASE